MKDILKRIKILFCKTVSINGAFFVICTIGFFTGILPWYGFLVSGGSVLTYRAVQKIKDLISAIKGLNENL